jgi:hypothetical protein
MHLGKLLGPVESTYGSYWGPVKCTWEAPGVVSREAVGTRTKHLWKLLRACRKPLGKLLRKLLGAYRKHLEKHLGKLVGACKSTCRSS